MLCGIQAAHADMWTYVDRNGVKHFASSQLDRRYVLLFRAVSAPDLSASTGLGLGSVPSDVRVTAATTPSRTNTPLEISPAFMAVKPHLRAAADANQLDMALLQAIIATESGFNASAVSPKGAIGLMQLMPATAQRYGLASDTAGTVSAKLTDPKTNINTGARYLRDLIKLFPGQLDLALAAYNAGEGAVQKAGNRIPNFKETQKYVRSVMQLYNRLNPQAQRVQVVMAAPLQPNSTTQAGQTTSADQGHSDL